MIWSTFKFIPFFVQLILLNSCQPKVYLMQKLKEKVLRSRSEGSKQG